MKLQRGLAFVWENLGPMHVDRLEALAAESPDTRVVAIEFSRVSGVYAWQPGEASGFTLRTLSKPGKRAGGLLLAWRLLRECRKAGARDIFMCHYELWPVLLASWFLRISGHRVFAMIDSKFDDYPRNPWIELTKLVFLSPYRGAFTASLRSRDYMRFLRFRPERIALGYDTLSVDRIAALAEVPPAPDGTPFAERDFVIVARLVPKKNIAVAIEAYRLWRTLTGRPRDLHICGSGPLEQSLRDQVEAAGLAAHVHFHGFVQTDAVARILGRSLCLLLTSVEEQYGLVVIEAQAMGLPVLVSRNAGACDILIDPGINGYTLDPLNAESCAALMLQLSEDEPTWHRFATAARDGRYRGDCRHFVTGVRKLVAL